MGKEHGTASETAHLQATTQTDSPTDPSFKVTPSQAPSGAQEARADSNAQDKKKAERAMDDQFKEQRFEEGVPLGHQNAAAPGGSAPVRK